MIVVAPSVLSANLGNLNHDLEMINQSEADWIHIDIMDGVFVPNISFGFPIMNVINKITTKIKDVHLMIEKPERYIKEFKQEGANILSVHYEASIHLHRTLQAIKKLDMKAGVALNPHTSIQVLEDIITEIDVVVLMSVNPGFGAQKFIENTYNKIQKLKELIYKKNSSALIEIDGGVTLENAQRLIECGVNVLVSGNTIFSNKSPTQVITKIKKLK